LKWHGPDGESEIHQDLAEGEAEIVHSILDWRLPIGAANGVARFGIRQGIHQFQHSQRKLFRPRFQLVFIHV